jgi:SagB-type dehydrogenase family enzyme
MAAPVPVGSVGRRYAFAHAYRRDESREPAVTRAGAWAPIRLEGARRVALPAPALGLLAGMDVADAIEAGGAARPSVAPFAERLATLLYANLGILRVDLNDPRGHAVHRAIPSPGNLFPSELFAYVPREGICHYDVLRHDLGLVRGEDEGARERLEAALDRSLEPFDAVVLVSSVLWRLVQKYANFAYRLACLEAGHLVGNLLVTARALGWRAEVQYRFDDDALEDALGLPPRSVATMAAVLLSAERPRWRLHPRGDGAVPRSAGTEEMERAARGPRLLEAIRRRHAGTAGPNGIAVRPAPISPQQVEAIATTAVAAYPSDLDGSPRPQVFAIANRVEGLAPAAYRCDGAHLRAATASPMPRDALWYRDLVDGAALGVIWALAIDYDAAFAADGERGYRLANLEAGLAAQRICLLAAGERVFARPFCAFDERVLDRWLGLAWTGLSTGYLVLHGVDRLPSLDVELPLVEGHDR